MKLLFLTQVFDRKDAVLGFVPRWIEGLARHCERVRVVALEAGDVSGMPPHVDTRVVGRKGRLVRYLRYRAILREAFERDGFDACLAHMVPRYALVAAGPARRANARLYLWYTHGAVDLRLRRAIARVEKVFTASSDSLRVDTAKRVVTGHGIDLDHFDRREEVPARPARLLAVGRMTPSKDPLTILAAVAILVARGHDLHLDLVGGAMTREDEVYMRAIREQVEHGGLRGRVNLAGSIPYASLPPWYRRATAVVNSSLTGSLDKVALEAMACERPVISCNGEVNSITAELGARALDLRFEAGSAAELAQRMQTVLALRQSERDAMGASLRAVVRRDHEVDRLMGRLCAEMGGPS